MTAFLLACTLNGIVNGGIYFRNVNVCLHYRDVLDNQSFIKNNETQTYECICKLVPFVDTDKVKVY
jgi:hypothetical protein